MYELLFVTQKSKSIIYMPSFIYYPLFTDSVCFGIDGSGPVLSELGCQS